MLAEHVIPVGMPWWEWLVMYLTIFFAMQILHPQMWDKGKIAKRWRIAKIRQPRIRPRNGFYAWWIICFLIHYTAWAIIGVEYDLIAALFYGGVIVKVIDDWLNGEDNGKRRWDSVKNKVKWRMELPPTPVEGQVRSITGGAG